MTTLQCNISKQNSVSDFASVSYFFCFHKINRTVAVVDQVHRQCLTASFP